MSFHEGGLALTSPVREDRRSLTNTTSHHDDNLNHPPTDNLPFHQTTKQNNQFIPYNEPFKENDYATFGGGPGRGNISQRIYTCNITNVMTRHDQLV